ncbi:MAG: hypothetical protein ACPG1Z_02640 [Planctomycetota bacterium]
MIPPGIFSIEFGAGSIATFDGKSVETLESVIQGALPPLPRQSMLFKAADLNHHVLNEIQKHGFREES